MDLFILAITAHFFLSLFLHSFFLHRYGTHRQFTMTRGWERAFFVLTWFFQGPSFLNPRSYAKMHLEHHAHSDTSLDPHSPKNFSMSRFGFDFPWAIMKMMFVTKIMFAEIRTGKHAIAQMYRERRFPEWKEFEEFADSSVSILGSAFIMFLIYLKYAHGWQWILLPVTILNGPVQGAIVNWCGHMWGYRNHDLPDSSKNTPIFSTLMLGELFQNNHHKHPENPNFGGPRWFEFDPLYPCILLLAKIGVIRLTSRL